MVTFPVVDKLVRSGHRPRRDASYVNKNHNGYKINFLEDLRHISPYRPLTSINPSVFGEADWDTMSPKERDELLGRVYATLVRQVHREIPFYSDLYKGIDPSRVGDMDDVLGLPVLRKFSTRYSRGLREATGPNEGLLKPQGRNSFSLFHTTGSTGYAQIPIFYSEPWDLDIERHAVARVWRMLGITSEDNVYDCYNPTHVGGYMFPGVCQIIGSGHEFKPAEKQLEETAQRLRDARNSGYPFTVLLAIPSSSGDPLGRKGTNFLTLYDETMDVFGKGGIDKVFLVGSGITPELIERIEAEMRDVKVSGAYGTAEHRPLSFSPTEGPTTRVCKYNQQHLTYGPHFTYVGRDEGNRVVPITTPGQEGDVYTIALRDGTPFINYQTGDVATIVTDACDCGLTSPVIGNIRRKNMEEIAGIGCRYD